MNKRDKGPGLSWTRVVSETEIEKALKQKAATLQEKRTAMTQAGARPTAEEMLEFNEDVKAAQALARDQAKTLARTQAEAESIPENPLKVEPFSPRRIEQQRQKLAREEAAIGSAVAPQTRKEAAPKVDAMTLSQQLEFSYQVEFTIPKTRGKLGQVISIVCIENDLTPKKEGKDLFTIQDKEGKFKISISRGADIKLTADYGTPAAEDKLKTVLSDLAKKTKAGSATITRDDTGDGMTQALKESIKGIDVKETPKISY